MNADSSQWKVSSFSSHASHKVNKAYSPTSAEFRGRSFQQERELGLPALNKGMDAIASGLSKEFDHKMGTIYGRSQRGRVGRSRQAGSTAGGGGIDGIGQQTWGDTSPKQRNRCPPILSPQRMVVPETRGQSPPRRQQMTTDEKLIAETFSPAAFKDRVQMSLDKRRSMGGDGAMQTMRPQKLRSGTVRDNSDMGTYLRLLRDAKLLAAACHRAGREKSEAAAHLRCAVLHDNMKQYFKAANCYIKYLGLCRTMGDGDGEAIACNAIGVDLQLGAKGLRTTADNLEKDGDAAGARQRRERAASALQDSLKYHKQHLLAADFPGQFIAHSNCGLVHFDLGDYDASMAAHQSALKIAMMMRDAKGQSMAVGNLGMVGKAKGDLVTAKKCMDQHLHLVRTMGDTKSEASAMSTLGEYAAADGDYEQATTLFARSRDLAEASGERGLQTIAAVNIGAAQGSMMFEQRIAELGEALRRGSGK